MFGGGPIIRGVLGKTVSRSYFREMSYFRGNREVPWNSILGSGWESLLQLHRIELQNWITWDTAGQIQASLDQRLQITICTPGVLFIFYLFRYLVENIQYMLQCCTLSHSKIIMDLASNFPLLANKSNHLVHLLGGGPPLFCKSRMPTHNPAPPPSSWPTLSAHRLLSGNLICPASALVWW